jgi:hypothetical protein
MNDVNNRRHYLYNDDADADDADHPHRPHHGQKKE